MGGYLSAVAAFAAYSLELARARRPANANGEAVLAVESEESGPVTLAKYTVEASEHLFSSPAYGRARADDIRRLAVLEGFSVGQTVVSSDETLDLHAGVEGTQYAGHVV